MPTFRISISQNSQNVKFPIGQYSDSKSTPKLQAIQGVSSTGNFVIDKIQGASEVDSGCHFIIATLFENRTMSNKTIILFLSFVNYLTILTEKSVTVKIRQLEAGRKMSKPKILISLSTYPISRISNIQNDFPC